MDYNKNLRIVRTIGSSYPFPYKDNVLWVHHDEKNNPIAKIWDHGKWILFNGSGSGSVDLSDYYTKEETNTKLGEYALKDNVKQPDWNTSDSADSSFIKNKPTKLSQFENDSDFLTEHQKLKTINGVSVVGDGNIDIKSEGQSIIVDSELSDTSENPVQNKVVANSISSISNRVASSDSLGMIKSGLVSDDGRLDVPYIHSVRKSAHNNFYSTINTILDTIYKKYNIEQFYTLVLESSRQLITIDSKVTYDEIYSSLYNNDSKSLSKLFFLIDDSSNDVDNSLINTTELFTVTSLTDSVFTFTINYFNIVDGENIYPNKCYVEFSFKSNRYNLAYYPICSPHKYVSNIEDGVSYNKNAIPTVGAIVLGLRNKVNIVSGKQLSTNDYTNEDKAKVDAALTEHQSLDNYYTKSEVDEKISSGGTFDPSIYYNKTEVNALLDDKQDNISDLDSIRAGATRKFKTINGNSIEGEGDIEISSGSQITVDSELNDMSENPVQNKAITSALTELQDYCFPTSLEATVSPSSIEWTGTSVQVSVGYKVLRNSKSVTADTVTINFNGETKILENTDCGSEKFTVTSQGYKSGSVSAKKGTTTIKNSPRGISVNLYLPVYYGFSKSTGKNDIVITELTKGGASINGTITLNNDDATKYLWLCVPSSMSISKVTSSGFDVPFLSPVDASTTLGSYKCYRTQDLPGSGDMTIVIS